jgi:hypothetical protein
MGERGPEIVASGVIVDGPVFICDSAAGNFGFVFNVCSGVLPESDD